MFSAQQLIGKGRCESACGGCYAAAVADGEQRRMALYLKKSFRAGPLRFNLSKSGLGLSGGVTGARVGSGPRGSYVHGGRHGLYYRKHLSSGQSRSNTDGTSGAMPVLVVVAIGLGAWFLNWLIENPLVLAAGVVVAVGVPVSHVVLRFRQKKLLAAYKNTLDVTLVGSRSRPSAAAIGAIRQQRQGLPKNKIVENEISRIEADVYQAVLDKVLDDGVVTKEEAEIIKGAEESLGLSSATRLQTKKEIFSAAYVEAIQDREITTREVDTLRNLIVGLGIPRDEVQDELIIVQEILDTQALRLPFKPIPPSKLTVRTQKSEEAYYQCSAKVFSKKKSKTLPSGYEYTLRRDGTMVLTDKRIMIVGEGTTRIEYSEVADLAVDIDDGMIVVTKSTSSRAVYIKTDAPIYAGRAINLLVEAHATVGSE